MRENKTKWAYGFRRVPTDALGRPGFYVKGSRRWLFSYDGYRGGHALLDQILSICKESKFPTRTQGADSSMNVSDRQTFFAFLDGGLEVFEGNYMFGERGQGAYLRGFQALRWMLCQLDLTQPRRLKGEAQVLDYADLEKRLDVPALPFVSIGRSRPR